MAQKNDTLPLLIALITCGAFVGLGVWWFLRIITSPVVSGKIISPGEIATFAEVSNLPEGKFRYGGSTTFAPIREMVDREISRVLPQFQLIYVDPISGTPGSGKGIEMLIENQLSFAQSSRSLKDKEQQKAQTQGFNLQEVSVAIDGIAVAVHPNLNISGLTVTQVKEIYTGKITNWQQLGGPNLTIIPYSRDPKDGGTVEFFQTHVLDKEPFGKNIQYVYSTTPGLQKVRDNPGGIYYASAPEVVPQCQIKPLALGKKAGEWVTPYQQPYIAPANCPNQRNTINQTAFQQASYPLTRNIFVIVKKNGQLDEKAGIAYVNLLLTQQGQDSIQKAGFVSLR